MLEGEKEGGMVISHCSGDREKEHVWSKILKIMGDAQGFSGTHGQGCSRCSDGHGNHQSVGDVGMTVYKAAETGALH